MLSQILNFFHHLRSAKETTSSPCKSSKSSDAYQMMAPDYLGGINSDYSQPKLTTL